MKLGTFVAASVRELKQNGMFAGKTNIQKIIYFSLSENDRKNLYRPYHYGPYCGEVQQAINALVNKDVLQYDGTIFTINENRFVPDEKIPVISRIKSVVQYLIQQQITKSDEISFLAKIHLLSQNRQNDDIDNVILYIQKQARFLGWKELAQADRKKVSDYLNFAQSLNLMIPPLDVAV